MEAFATKQKYSFEVSFDEIIKLIKSLSVNDKIQLEKELEKETLIHRSEKLSKRIMDNSITMAEIVDEVKTVRANRNEK